VPPSSEGHTYRGPLRDGYWVDAADLTAGYRLLNDDASWAEVVSVEVVAEALEAYNLTVADYHTYFVAANENASPVWVHNTCNWKPVADYKLWNKGKIKTHFDKHADDFGAQNYDEYTQMAKSFATEVNGGNRFVDAVDGSFVYRFEHLRIRFL